MNFKSVAFYVISSIGALYFTPPRDPSIQSTTSTSSTTVLHPSLTCYFLSWIYVYLLAQDFLRKTRKRKDKKKRARKVPQTLDLSAEVIKCSPTYIIFSSFSRLTSPTFSSLTNTSSLSSGDEGRVPKTMSSSRFTKMI